MRKRSNTSLRLSGTSIINAMILAAVGLSLVLITSGCERHIESKDPVRSLPAEPPAPVNVVSQINDRAVQLSWEVTDSANVSRFRIYRSPADSVRYTLH
ncbi:hypothetical protein GF377_10315, partial [candidate division GN15 bacterium]|nr:hypothetical protein [candidate division GN15 bacterium]